MDIFQNLLEKDDPAEPTLVISLDHHQRRRSRLRVVLPSGEAVGLALPRGVALKEGDRLRSEPSRTVARVRAAPEHVSVVETSNPHLLARAAYHLGNRHVALRVEPGRLIYPHDHVLDGLCRELGLQVAAQLLPFEPEGGGYSGEHGHAAREGVSAAPSRGEHAR
jgi:urease accessory protein